MATILCLVGIGVIMLAAAIFISYRRTRAMVRKVQAYRADKTIHLKTLRPIDLTPPETCYRDGRCGYCDRLAEAERAELAQQIEQEKCA